MKMTHTDVTRALTTLTRIVRQQETVISCISQLTELLVANQKDLQDELDVLRQAILDDEATDTTIAKFQGGTGKPLPGMLAPATCPDTSINPAMIRWSVKPPLGQRAL